MGAGGQASGSQLSQAPTMLIVADSDTVRLEHAVRMFRLLGGGIVGDLHGLPCSRLVVVPGTAHSGLCHRAQWVVPMMAEFLDDAGPSDVTTIGGLRSDRKISADVRE